MRISRRAVAAGLGAALPVGKARALLFGSSSGVTQTIVSVSPSSGSFASGAGTNTVIAAVGVTMSPASPAFTGTLSLTGADAASFNLSSSTLPSNLRTTGSLADGTYHINIVATQAGATGSPFTQAVTIAGGAATLTTVAVANFGSSTLTAPYVQFGHPFKAGDLLSAQILSITDDLGGAVSYTAARRSTGGIGTDTRFAALCCKLPNNIPGKLAVTSITHSGTTATVTTSSAHSLSSGAKVIMEGQAPDDYCGIYTITVTGASTLTYTMPTTPATNATTAGDMLYTRVLTLASASGSWNDALPAGKTSANILTDLAANFDNPTLTLTTLKNSAGSTVGSGTYVADFATAAAATGTNGRLRTPYTGPTMCDFHAFMKIKDNTGGAVGPLVAHFFVTAMLNPSTGAVVEVHARCFIDQSLSNIAMDYYTYQTSLKLGSTVIRSTGLSTNATIDGKVQSFAPSAVNTTTGVINIPSHGFQGGERVQLTNSGGALPTGFSALTDYAVVYVDGNNIKVSTSFDGRNQMGTSTPLIPSTQGSGTHTVTCWLQSPMRRIQAYVAADGLPDRWTGNTGSLSPITYHVAHTSSYLVTSGYAPPVDLTINFSSKTATRTNTVTTLDAYVFGAAGSLQYDQDTGGAGAHHEYGAPWTDVPLRSLRYPGERGFRQTLRNDAMMMGSWDFALTKDDTNWRIPVVNNGPDRAGGTYTGMSASQPTAQWYTNRVFIGFTTPTSTATYTPFLDQFSFTHRYILVSKAYLFEGRQEFHHMLIHDTSNTLLPRSEYGDSFPTSQNLVSKRFSIGGTDYYTCIPQTECRADGWMILVLTEGQALIADDAVEKPYLKDIFNDALKTITGIIAYAAANDPNWVALGGWGDLIIANLAGPGNTADIENTRQNCELAAVFMTSLVGLTWPQCYRLYPHSDLRAGCVQLATFYDNLWRVLNGFRSASFSVRTKYAPGSFAQNGSAAVTTVAVNDVFELDNDLDLNGGGVTLFRTDGVVWGISTGNFDEIPPIAGDRHYLTNNTNGSPFADGPPPELNRYGTYYVRQPAGSSYQGWKYATTNSDGTIVSSYSASSSSTLNGAINSSTTSITTAGVLTFSSAPSGTYYPLIVCGTEIMKVTAGFGTTSLTVIRGYGVSTAASHASGDAIYVPYTVQIMGAFQDRNAPYPPTGHISYWGNGSTTGAPFGYLTMARASCFYGALNGLIARTAFDNADAWFQDTALIPYGLGPQAFIDFDTIMHSVDATLL